MQPEIEVEQLLEEVAGRPRPIVERDRFFADHQGGICETRVARSHRVLKVRVQRVRLHDAGHEPAVRGRSGLEGDLLVPDALAAGRRQIARSLRRLAATPALPTRRGLTRRRRFRPSAFGQSAWQRQIAELVEIENVTCKAQRPVANLGRLLRPACGKMAVELRVERREVLVEEIEQGDPVVVFLEAGPRGQRREKICVEKSTDESLCPTALFEAVRRQCGKIVDD